MEYGKGYVYKLMDQGGPTNTRESYFNEAALEMLRSRDLCHKANLKSPLDKSYINDLEELSWC